MNRTVDKQTGIGIKTTKQKLIIEVPISGMIRAFHGDPNNDWDDKPIAKVGKGKRQEFVNWIAEYITDESNADTGDSYLMEMFGNLFSRLVGDAPDFLEYTEDNEVE